MQGVATESTSSVCLKIISCHLKKRVISTQEILCIY